MWSTLVSRVLVLAYNRLKTCEQRRSELFAKQGRGQQFSSEKERDSWIKKVGPHNYMLTSGPIDGGMDCASRASTQVRVLTALSTSSLTPTGDQINVCLHRVQGRSGMSCVSYCLLPHQSRCVYGWVCRSIKGRKMLKR